MRSRPSRFKYAAGIFALLFWGMGLILFPLESAEAQAPAAAVPLPGGAAAFSAASGMSNVTNLNGALVTPTITGDMVFTNTYANLGQQPSYAPGGGVMALNFCASMIRSLSASGAFGGGLQAAAYDANRASGWGYDPEIQSWVGKRAGTGIDSYYRENFGDQAAGCQQFMNENGELGPWGRQIVAQLEAESRLEDIYTNWVPDDMNTVCSNYQSFDRGQRKAFWVWFFASLAEPESTCNPEAANPDAPNGTAIGLFQLESNKCGNIPSRDLYIAENNIECAVRLFAKESQRRNTMFHHCSNCPGGTYWDPLRSGRATNNRVISQLRAFPGCNGAVEAPSADQPLSDPDTDTVTETDIEEAPLPVPKPASDGLLPGPQ